MKMLDTFKLIGISLLCAVGLSACDKPGPAESAGKKIDQVVENTDKKIEQAVDQASKTMSNAADKAGEKLGEQGAIAGVAMDDAEITAKVKAAIFAEPGLKTLQISVDTSNGAVVLSGSADSSSSSNRAKALAGAVTGVNRVDNRLVLKSP
ncbi:Transport-associated protein [Candidatus Accumulibacter aalborgensis]|uniref:Transport-associated protein n=1 Tax=Candidatus Accumulibacter aalborgensis TaxID=1860102 RepID=A0A1A8XH21_9PROT|nr:BON domain-containing protein [Candidatus Accumulibacter aalborgensis]SBT04455.1 Transport-associated protein [Candidatus Accumulibacter aalborgensis]